MSVTLPHACCAPCLSLAVLVASAVRDDLCVGGGAVVHLFFVGGVRITLYTTLFFSPGWIFLPSWWRPGGLNDGRSILSGVHFLQFNL